MGNELTVREILIKGTRDLTIPGNTNPRLDAEFLLGMALCLDRAALLARPHRIVSSEESHSFFSWIELRKKQFPLQYIRGFQEFYGRNFLVTPDVLIPRPETELLIDTCLDLCATRHKSSRPIKVLDIGTGSGCIAITLAAENSNLRLVGTDISMAALNVSQQNARTILSDRSQVSFILTDLGNGLARAGSFDIVISNPPYVGWKDLSLVDPSVRMYEPGKAVFSGDSGLEFFSRIFSEIPPLLQPDGYLLVEIGAGQEKKLSLQAERLGWSCEAILPDLAGIPRCMLFRPGNHPPGS